MSTTLLGYDTDAGLFVAERSSPPAIHQVAAQGSDPGIVEARVKMV